MTYQPNPITDYKSSVRAASTANVNISSPGSTLDGVALAAGNRVLLKDQTTASQNGIYLWTGSGTALTRVTDADSTVDLNSGLIVYVEEGTTNQKTFWTLTTSNPITLGTTALTFENLFAGASSPADASTTTKGIVKLSSEPASPTEPIAVGDNDSRMTNARTPTAHASSHEPNGSDPLTGYVSSSVANVTYASFSFVPAENVDGGRAEEVFVSNIDGGSASSTGPGSVGGLVAASVPIINLGFDGGRADG